MTPAHDDDTALAAKDTETERDILNTLMQAVLLVGADNVIKQVFASTEAIFHRSRESLAGRPVSSLQGIGPRAEELIDRARQEVVPMNSYDMECAPPIGDVELVDLQASPYGTDGQMILAIQPRRITAFLEKLDDMEAAARSVRGLASMLGHEIKNPLSGIRGAAQLLGRTGGSSSLKMTELICKEVDRIKTLVEQLEGFGISDRTDYGPVNIHEVLDHVLNLTSAGVASDCTLRPVFDPSLPAVHGDFDKLVQVFLNLVKNAVEASGNKAEIKIQNIL